jgi:hypothetical protein
VKDSIVLPPLSIYELITIVAVGSLHVRIERRAIHGRGLLG